MRRFAIVCFFALLVGMVAATASAAYDGLDAVNAKRSQYGLSAFQRDDALSAGAAAAVDYRAANRIGLHIMSGWNCLDFNFVPSGAAAAGSGTGYSSGMMGWNSCYDTSGYRYAGAAWATDQYGTRYMHLFVSDRPNGPIIKVAKVAVAVVQAVAHPIQTVQAVRQNQANQTYYYPQHRRFFRRWQ